MGGHKLLLGGYGAPGPHRGDGTGYQYKKWYDSD